ncbi:MAG: PAS domain-containing protein, partial [Ferruginibacter sp.]
MLGKSETTGIVSELFAPYIKKDKIFIRQNFTARPLLQPLELTKAAIEENEKLFTGISVKDNFQKAADHLILAKYTPAGVIVNEQFDIIQFRGSTGEFLEPAPGKASLNVLKMAKDGLGFEIRNGLHKVKSSNQVFTKTGIPLNKTQIVDIEVIPLVEKSDLYFLILFLNSRNSDTVFSNKDEVRSIDEISARARIDLLESDLAQAREDMRTITEEQEVANEELQTANEELLSSSEELQSLNEELETSQEELQSTNEELITLNHELFERNELFNDARLYAEGIISTIHEPLLVLTADFKIKSANQSFLKVFNLTDDMVFGNSLFEICNGAWDKPKFRQSLSRFSDKHINYVEWEEEFIFSDIGRKNLCINAQPLRKEGDYDLILLAIDDITSRKEAEARIKHFSDDLEKLVIERTASLKKSNLEL